MHNSIFSGSQNDVEKGSVHKDRRHQIPSPAYSFQTTEPNYDEITVIHQSLPRRILDSFKRDPHLTITPNGVVGADGRVFDADNAANATANAPLSRSLKSRHLQMIAIGGSIGTGLFVASGKALHSGGPASLLISFTLIGLMMYCTVHALGELAVVFPVAGSFSAYSTRFIDPAWGFAMGWNYAYVPFSYLNRISLWWW